MSQLDLPDLVNSALVSTVLGWGGEEYLNNHPNLIIAQQISANADDIAVVMLARAAGGELIVRPPFTVRPR